eukprot:7805685-Alexandrium_andersonii.AAC.1
MMRARVPQAARRVEEGPQLAYLSDREIVNVQIGDVGLFQDDVVAWARYWQPGDPVIRLLQSMPLEVICIVLGRPSGWGE